MLAYHAVLTALRNAGENWMSGQVLSNQLGVSRTAIWKQIEALRAAGYTLEAKTRHGYRLVASPDSVTPDEVLSGLTTERFGQHIVYRESVGSTNDLAKELARAGAVEGTLVLADEQTAGKGRLGRVWTTPKGGALAMSLILRPDLPPHLAPRLTLVAAVAVAHALHEVTGVAVGIKWPNDLQVEGRKLCGILTEMEAEMERVAFVVLGIGLNVNLPLDAMDEEVRRSATSLLAVTGACVSRAPLVRAILTHFEQAYDLLLHGRFDEVLAMWRTLSVTLGQSVRVISVTGQPTFDGVAESVDEEGGLLVRLANGHLHRVIAGEVSIRPVVTDLFPLDSPR
jgi:BirA family biotin operon repressor/biotin-[acetyl-CoA-carboxylase] ligase